MSTADSWRNIVDQLRSISEGLESIRQRVVADKLIPYESQDARHVALDGLQVDVGACGMWINTLLALRECTKSEEAYTKALGTRLPSRQAEDVLLNYVRLSLTTKVHFKIENLLANILRALSIQVPKGFWNISDQALRQAGMSTTGYEKQVLTALANLRNSFHGNGIHNGSDLRVELPNAVLEFQKGKPVECASWKHIVAVLEANVAVLGSLLFAGAIDGIKGPIRDEFAESA